MLKFEYYKLTFSYDSVGPGVGSRHFQSMALTLVRANLVLLSWSKNSSPEARSTTSRGTWVVWS